MGSCAERVLESSHVAHFTWEEMKAYWRAHSIRWSNIDLERDPDGLANVCHPGAPLWFNRYYDRIQRQVLLELLNCVPPAAPGDHALDIGCGAGRWSRLLAARKYSVSGIDLQKELIEIDRRRDPGIDYSCVSLQDYSPSLKFKLIVSVTVLQHNPYDEQAAAAKKIGELLAEGGHLILLEDTGKEAAGLFPRSIANWRGLFEDSGLVCLEERPYDYSPFIRMHWWVVSRALALFRRMTGMNKAPTPETYLAPSSGRLSSVLRAGSDAARFAAAALDRIIEPACRAARAGPSPLQCGFLFKAR